MVAKAPPRGSAIARSFPATFLFTITVCLAACSHKAAPLGRYQTIPVAADGIPDEWTLPLRFSNPGNTLQYNVTNDDRNIYICVMSHDERTILRMLRAGMTVYFDPKGQTARNISLHYPLRKQPDPKIRSRNSEPPVNHNDSGWKEELMQQSDAYGTTGFSDLQNGQFPAGDRNSPIRVAIRLSRHDSLLVYEAVIPIGNVPGAGFGSHGEHRSLSIGIVLNTPSGQTLVNNAHHSSKFLQHRRSYDTSTPDSPPITEDASWYQFRLAAATAQKS